MMVNHVLVKYGFASTLPRRLAFQFLADRTNGRAIATLLRLSSSSVCDVMYCG